MAKHGVPTDCLNTWLPLSILLCEGYSVNQEEVLYV